MSGKGSKKRSKEYYIKSAKAPKGRHWGLEAGMRGFLISTNNERDAVREAYNLFNQYADKIWGPEKLPDGEDQTGGDDNGDDIAAAMKREVDSLKEAAKPSQRRFQQVRSGAKNVIFIKTLVDDPYRLVHDILTEVYETEQHVSRYMMRIQPVTGICKIHQADDVGPLVRQLLTEHFEVPHSPSFSVMFRARNNTTIKREDIYKTIGTIIEDLNPESKVHFTSPDIVINVDVICSMCCVGVVKDFFKLRRYNIQEVPNAKSSTASAKVVVAGDGANGEVQPATKGISGDVSEPSNDPTVLNSDGQDKEPNNSTEESVSVSQHETQSRESGDIDEVTETKEVSGNDGKQ